jgi:L-alanine-DL-glutamate epimerase-like enolase superfamily enzyme
MKITGAKTSLIRSRVESHARCLLEVHTDAGITGTAVGTAGIRHHATHLVEELLLDADPRATSFLWQQLSQANAQANGALTATIAALDIALWDAKSKANNEPLWRTLGALRPNVNVHARVPSDTGISLKHWCRSLVASTAVRNVVITASGNSQADLSTLLTAREALSAPGVECALILDAREQWSTKAAIRAITEIERSVDLSWIEGPIDRHDFLGHKRLLDSIRSGVCAGGKLSSAAGFLPHLHHHSLSVVQLDLALLGITAALQIADAAYGFEIPVALTNSPGNLHVHVGAALPYCASVEIAGGDTFINSDIRIQASRAVGGDRPGHGLLIDSLDIAAA